VAKESGGIIQGGKRIGWHNSEWQKNRVALTIQVIFRK